MNTKTYTFDKNLTNALENKYMCIMGKLNQEIMDEFLFEIKTIFIKAIESETYISLALYDNLLLEFAVDSGDINFVKWIIEKREFMTNVLGIESQRIIGFADFPELSINTSIFGFCKSVEIGEFLYQYCVVHKLPCDLFDENNNYYWFNQLCFSLNFEMITWFYSMGTTEQRRDMINIIKKHKVKLMVLRNRKNFNNLLENLESNTSKKSVRPIKQ
jgi:hypothetical protein